MYFSFDFSSFSVYRSTAEESDLLLIQHRTDINLLRATAKITNWYSELGELLDRLRLFSI